jgi:hypothetical protein
MGYNDTPDASGIDELLVNGAGIIRDFGSAAALASAVQVAWDITAIAEALHLMFDEIAGASKYVGPSIFLLRELRERSGALHEFLHERHH